MDVVFTDCTVTAFVHSHEGNGPEKVELLKQTASNEFIVRTKEGVECYAILNLINGFFYADDIYRIRRKDSEKQ